MDHEQLIALAELRPMSSVNLSLPALPRQGAELLARFAQVHRARRAAHVTCDRIGENVELTAMRHATSSWYKHRGIVLLMWDGDLTIEGDLIDDDAHLIPMLWVRGSLTVRNWLRGGMPAFIGGDVHATGYLVGQYNDAALFVGGGLRAAGYIHRARPYPDLRDVEPHQIAGGVEARRFDTFDASSESLRETFDAAVLFEGDDGEVYLDEQAVLTRQRSGQAVWREPLASP